MRYILPLFLFCFSITTSQQQKIDSLTTEFHRESNDSIKAEILAKIGIAAYYVNFDKAKYYNDSLIKFSKNKSDKHLGFGYRMQGTLQLINGDFKDSEQSYLKSLDIFRKIKDTVFQGALIANLATLYARQNQITKADSMYLKAIDIMINSNEKNQSINCYINLGINASNANKLEKATKYFIETLRLAEDADNKNYILYAQSRLGDVYLKRQLYEKAQKSLIIAEKIGKEINDKTGLASVYNSFGALYEELKNNKKSLEYFLLSEEAAELVNDKDQLSKAYINKGRQYDFLNQPVNAQKSFEKAIALTQSIQDSSKIVTANLNLAGLLLKMNKISQAEKSITDANKFMPKIPDDDYFMHYKRISDEYARLNRKSKAYDFLKKYSQTVDSLYSKNDVSKIADIETKYQTEKKEKENLQLRTEKAEQELETANANRLKWIFAIGLIGAVISLIIFNHYYRKNKKQKELIENLQKELHHRVKNNLSIIDTFIEVVKDEFNEPKFSGKLSELQNRIDSINEVHLQLYKSDDLTNVDLEKYINSLSQNIQQSFNNSKITIEKEINDSIKLDPNKSFPLGLIINEFLTNSFKYAFDNEGGKVKIALSGDSKNIELYLSDNGKGLPENFNIETTESFGMRFIKLLSEQLNGSFNLKEGNGVNVVIKFPK